jgi:hypothetical protein
MSKLIPCSGGIRAYCGVPEANSIIDKASVVVEVVLKVNEEAIFFSYTIVNGCERWRRATSHGDAFCSLDDDVAKLENIVFEQNLDGVEDGGLTGVQAKFVGDMAVVEIALECHEAMLGVDIRIHADGVHREDSNGRW